MLLVKDFESVQEPVQPQDPDLLQIRKYAKRDVTAEDVFCGAFRVCNTRIDRAGERFTKAYLERFRDTLPGKSLLEGHNTQNRPLGRFYNAEVLPDGDEWYLKGYYYLAAESPIVREIELGIAKDCSIGYAAGKRVCGVCSKTWLPYRQGECRDHQPLEEYDGKQCVVGYCDSEVHKAEAHEVSLVYLGCQYGAEATAKTYLAGLTEEQRRFWMMGVPLLSPTAPRKEESGMFKSLEEANAEGPRLKAEIERLQKLPLAVDRERELTKALSEKEPLAKDGATYRQWLRDEVLRMAGTLDEADVKDGKPATKKQMYTGLLGVMPADASAESLLGLYNSVKAEFDGRLASGAGHNNGPDPKDNDKEKKPGLMSRFASGGYW